MDDQAVVSRQLGRPARPFRRVAVRCEHGFPAVTEQPAFTDDGSPFPTTYYLTCPWLVAALARSEAEGGVSRWTEAAAEDPALTTERRKTSAEESSELVVFGPQPEATVAGFLQADDSVARKPG